MCLERNDARTPAPTTVRVRGATHKEAGAWTQCTPQRRASRAGSRDHPPQADRQAVPVFIVVWPQRSSIATARDRPLRLFKSASVNG